MRAIEKVLSLRGFHFLATRFGSRHLRGLAFDEKFRCGDWNFSSDGLGELGALVMRYANGGDVLIMGCGSASILKDLKPDTFSSVLGVDISAEAIRLAGRYAASNVSFQQQDMVSFKYQKQYDVILFSESLNYVPFFKRRALLERLCDYLKPNGSILVTIAQAKRYAGILAMIRRHFRIIEDRKFSGSDRHLIVFRANDTQ